MISIIVISGIAAFKTPGEKAERNLLFLLVLKAVPEMVSQSELTLQASSWGRKPNPNLPLL